MFYTYRQNNSGGYFVGPTTVIVEADNADEANQIAEANDLYFDGCSTGDDCSCCGDRWHRQYSDDGTLQPEIYGNPAVEDEDTKIIRKNLDWLAPII
jgi:hypothetical protein